MGPDRPFLRCRRHLLHLWVEAGAAGARPQDVLLPALQSLADASRLEGLPPPAAPGTPPARELPGALLAAFFSQRLQVLVGGEAPLANFAFCGGPDATPVHCGSVAEAKACYARLVVAVAAAVLVVVVV